MPSKLKSRKMWAAIVAVVFTLVALIGTEMPYEQVAVVDGIIAFWIFIEGLVDAFRRG